jgi:2-C-methyl-D-erythritol 2,4-cyclodiphosphate synthase
MRVGLGYDIHPLVEGRDLVLGGVRIEHDLGLEGHSDADALVHALCDAILGAIGEGDLGRHFPETDEFRDADSLALLGKVAEMMSEKGYCLVNADCIVHAEQPKIAPHAAAMAKAMAGAMGAEPDRIAVKATRGEGMGPVGEKRAIAARAVVLLERTDRGV